MTKIPLWFVPGSADEPQRFVVGEQEIPEHGKLVTFEMLDRLQFVGETFGALSLVIYPSVEVAQAEVDSGPAEDSVLHDRYYGELSDGRGAMLHCNREKPYYPLVDTRRFEDGHTYPLGEGDPICSWTVTRERAEELGFELYGPVPPALPTLS